MYYWEKNFPQSPTVFALLGLVEADAYVILERDGNYPSVAELLAELRTAGVPPAVCGAVSAPHACAGGTPAQTSGEDVTPDAIECPECPPKASHRRFASALSGLASGECEARER